MMDSRKDHQLHQVSEGDVSSSSTSSVEDQHIRKHPYTETFWDNRMRSNLILPLPQFESLYNVEKDKHVVRNLPGVFELTAEERLSEISVYNTRIQRYITKPEKMCIDSDLSSSEKVVAEIAERLKVEQDCVVFQQYEATSEESIHPPFVVVLPEARQAKTLTLILYCHYFDQFKGKKRYCFRIDKNLRVSEVKEILKAEFEWKGAEIYINGSYISDDRTLGDLNMHEFSQLEAAKSVSKMLMFLYQPSSDIVTRFRLGIYTSDSVKQVKEKFVEHFQNQFTVKHKTGDRLHITCANELLNDEQCFGLTDKFHREDVYQIHFAPTDAVLCHLHCQTGKEKTRVLEKRIILMSPTCSTADLREEASKVMRVDPKAVRLNIDNKQRIDEVTNISEVSTLYSGCSIFAGIKKKKTLHVKHPASDKPERVANLYAMEPVSTLRKLIAKRYGINELQIVLKYKGTTMKDTELLYNYPIKNNIVLELHIFERRLNIVAHITFKRTKIALIIDDCEKTTIDEILKYCAVKLQYRSSCSRCVFEGQCLDKNLTLHAAVLTPGCKVNIIYFSEEGHLNGRLKRIYMVSPDGRIIPRYGSVAGGLLLHASKKVTLMPCEEKCYVEETLPEGIHKTQLAKDGSKQQTESRTTEQGQDFIEYTKKSRVLKRFYIKKAKRLIAKKFLKAVRLEANDSFCPPRINMVFSDEALPIQERNDKFDYSIHEAEDNDQTFVKTVFSDCPANSDPLSDEKADLRAFRPDFYLGEEEFQELSAESIHVLPQSGAYKERLSEVMADGSHKEFADACTEHAPNKEITCGIYKNTKCFNSDTKSSNSMNQDDILPSLNQSKKPVVMQNVKASLGSSYNFEENKCSTGMHQHGLQNSSCNVKTSEDKKLKHSPDESHCSNANLEYGPDSGNCHQNNVSLPPVVLSDICIKTLMEKSVINTVNSNTSSDSGFRIDTTAEDSESSTTYDVVLFPRRRTESENSNAISLNPRQWPVPRAEQQINQVNKLLTTAGISIPLLDYVSREIGTDWKRLARRLEVDEGDIKEIEHNCKSSLCEAAFQSLVVWKKQNGSQASRGRLLSALRGIKLNHLAEACESYPSGYQTA